MKHYLLTIFLGLVTGHTVNAQSTRTVYGQVKDPQGRPLAGAALRLTRTGSTSMTDSSGRYTILQRRYPDTLLITHIGHQARRIPLDNQTPLPLSFRLETAVNTLEAVVVSTGYQDLPKERATGSFYQVDKKLLDSRTGPDLLSRLNGLTSSLLVDQHNPTLPTLQVRGLSTLNYAAAQPLIVLDNFPYNGNLSNINPNDIESVTLLKDAAASSIWGARAGNGVLVINTRKARKGQPLQVSANANVTVAPAPDLYSADQLSVGSTLDVERYLFDQGYYNNLFTSRTRPAIPQSVEILQQQKLGQLSTAQAAEALSRLRGQDVRTDMARYLYRTQVNQQYYLNLSGAGERIRYLMSAGYDRGSSSLRGNDQDRLTLRTGNTLDLTSKWQLQSDLILTGTTQRANSPGGYGAIRSSTAALSPYARLVNPDGSPAAVDIYYRGLYSDTAGAGKLLDWKYRPLQELAANNKRTGTTDLLAALSTSYKVSHWLSADVRYQFQQNWATSEQLSDLNTFFTRDYINRFTQISGTTVTNNVPRNAILVSGRTTDRAHSLRGQLNIDQRWGDHRLNALLGGEIRSNNSASTNFRTYGYDPNSLNYVSVDYARAYPTYGNIYGTAYITDGTQYKQLVNRFVSTFANAAYTYQDRYTLSGSIRRDASNLFGVTTNQKWVPLWSAGALWKVHREPFYHLDALPQLNVRLSYGVSGNLSPNATALSKMQYYAGSQSPINVPFAGLLAPPDPQLRWEQVKSWNAGMDLQLAGGRIGLSADVYGKHSTDLYNSVILDPTLGFGTADQNSASIRSKGVDVVLNTVNLNGPVRWQSMLLLNYVSYRTTKNLNPPTEQGLVSDGQIIFPVIGQNPYVIVSYRWAGLDPQSGDPRGYLNGQVSKDYQGMTRNPLSEQIIHGSAVPPVFGNLHNSLSWKQLSLAWNIAYKFGYYFRKPALSYTDLFSRGSGYSTYEERWQRAGDEQRTNVPSQTYPANAQRDNFYRYAEINVEKADHIRLTDLTLSYQLPALRWLPGVRSVELYGYASQLNWILWRANPSGLDPEVIYNLRPPANYAAGLKLNL